MNIYLFNANLNKNHQCLQFGFIAAGETTLNEPGELEQPGIFFLINTFWLQPDFSEVASPPHTHFAGFSQLF